MVGHYPKTKGHGPSFKGSEGDDSGTNPPYKTIRTAPPSARSSSREVRLRVPTFFCSLFEYGNPPNQKRGEKGTNCWDLALTPNPPSPTPAPRGLLNLLALRRQLLRHGHRQHHALNATDRAPRRSATHRDSAPLDGSGIDPLRSLFLLFLRTEKA